MAYRPTGPGLNLALDPATSTAYEIGMKWLPTATQRLNLAAFTATTDKEIVVDTATGGRTTFRNASKTNRRGFEAAWDADLGRDSSRMSTTRTCWPNSPTPTHPAFLRW